MSELLSEAQNNKEIATISDSDVRYVNRLISQQIAKNTRRGYVSDFKIFSAWCKKREIEPLNASPEHIAIFMANEFEGGAHPSTVKRRLAAIRFAYRSAQKVSPTENDMVRATLKGIKRDENARKTKSKNPLTNHVLIKIMPYIPENTLRGIRDRAIFLMLFGGAFRLSELIAIRYEDIQIVEDGIDVVLYRSKTNQEGEKQVKSISRGDIYCPSLALQEWLSKSGVCDGHLFRTLTAHDNVLNTRVSASSLYSLIKKYCQRAGYSFEQFSPHSLRAGFTTSAIENGKNIYKVMDVTLHSSLNSLKPYIKFADRYKDHPGKGLL